MERPYYIIRGNKNIFAVLHTPGSVINKKGIIFLHPYAEEKQYVDRIFVHFARLLCSRGYFVMRFDFYGCGDSEGNFEELTFESQISDIQSISNQFIRDTGIGEISLFGVRLGASIAIQYAGIDKNINNLILWSPIVNGAEYAATLLRNKIFASFAEKKKISKENILNELYSEGRVDIDGYYLTKHYYDFLNDMNVTNSVHVCKGNVFIGITKSESSFYGKYDFLVQQLQNNGIKCDLVTTDDKMYWNQHTFYELYFPHDLINHTLDWISQL